MPSTLEISVGSLLRLITVLVVRSYSVAPSLCDYTHLIFGRGNIGGLSVTEPTNISGALGSEDMFILPIFRQKGCS